jgi:hypothetical protein
MKGYPNMTERDRAEMHNRKIRAVDDYKVNLSVAQKSYLARANRTARVEKQVRRGEKGGMTAFTATLRHDTSVRLNQVPKGLKSANLEVLISRGWLWGSMWSYIHDLYEELEVKDAQIKLLLERKGDEEE